MSTIHDALKKLEKNMQPPEPKSPQTTPPPVRQNNPFNPPPANLYSKENLQQRPPDPYTKNKKRRQMILLLILIGLIGTLIWMMPSALQQLDIPQFNLKRFSLPFLRKKVSSTIFVRPSPANTIKTPDKTSGPLLQGIMVMGNKNIALIDNNPYEIDEKVGNMTITAISKNTVTLKDENGEEKILKISK